MKKAITVLIVCVLVMTMSLPALAYSYEFSGEAAALGKATGTDAPVSVSPMSENVRRDKDTAALPPPYYYGSGIIPTDSAASVSIAPPVGSSGYSIGFETPTSMSAPTYYSDGSIGILSIPVLGISMKAYEGATTENMNRGVAHFANTSAWNGNIGLAGHNRGGNYNIGTIRYLNIGDTITYTTPLGRRTYKVAFVGTIAETDWTYLAASADNRITLITCLADQPTVRVCVQAVAG